MTIRTFIDREFRGVLRANIKYILCFGQLVMPIIQNIDRRLMSMRCAYYEYLNNGTYEEFEHMDISRTKAVDELAPTVIDFVEGKINLATLKYRSDDLSSKTAMLFPDREFSQHLRELVLGLPVEVVEPALRKAFQLPDDDKEAKGKMLEFSYFLDDMISQKKTKEENMNIPHVPELLSTMWHSQDPNVWPLVLPSTRHFLKEDGTLETYEPIADYFDYRTGVRLFSEEADVPAYQLDHVCHLLLNGRFDHSRRERLFRKSDDQGRCALI